MEKTTRWAFTAYEDQWNLFESIPPLVAEWGWNTEECPETGRKHYQGFIRTTRQVRFSQMKTMLPGVHIEQAKNWNALLLYCKKEDTRVDGTEPHHEVIQGRNMSMSEALIRVARNRPRLDYSRVESLEDFRKLHLREFEMAVSLLLREDANLIGLYSQPQYQRAYVVWRNDWVFHAERLETEESEKTDRQTDTEGA